MIDILAKYLIMIAVGGTFAREVVSWSVRVKRDYDLSREQKFVIRTVYWLLWGVAVVIMVLWVMESTD